MSASKIPEEWLERFNRKLSEKGIPHARRPFDAISEWTKEHHCSITLDSPTAKFVFQWFEAHSPTGSHAIGSLFDGAFYFDAYFWKISVPVGFGTFQLNALDSIENFPDFLRNQLAADRWQLTNYVSLWVDVTDYGYGIHDLRGGKLSGFAGQLASSADRELRATVRLLTELRRTNPKAIEAARMATEMFLKAYLAVHTGLDELQAKRISHDIRKAVERCKRVKGLLDFEEIAKRIGVFPAIDSRYESKVYDDVQLWQAYCVAQFTAATFVRSLTDRDTRPQIFRQSQPRSTNG